MTRCLAETSGRIGFSERKTTMTTQPGKHHVIHFYNEVAVHVTSENANDDFKTYWTSLSGDHDAQDLVAGAYAIYLLNEQGFLPTVEAVESALSDLAAQGYKFNYDRAVKEALRVEQNLAD